MWLVAPKIDHKNHRPLFCCAEINSSPQNNEAALTLLLKRRAEGACYFLQHQAAMHNIMYEVVVALLFLRQAKDMRGKAGKAEGALQATSPLPDGHRERIDEDE